MTYFTSTTTIQLKRNAIVANSFIASSFEARLHIRIPAYTSFRCCAWAAGGTANEEAGEVAPAVSAASPHYHNTRATDSALPAGNALPAQHLAGHLGEMLSMGKSSLPVPFGPCAVSLFTCTTQEIKYVTKFAKPENSPLQLFNHELIGKPACLACASFSGLAQTAVLHWPSAWRDSVACPGPSRWPLGLAHQLGSNH